jgi:hypothetical protein
MKLTRKDLDNILAVALDDLPTKSVGSACLGTAIIAATKLSLTRTQFMRLALRAYDTLQAAGGTEAEADRIAAVAEGSQN